MTVHAGQKAARLRRATNATSSSTISPVLLSTAAQWTPHPPSGPSRSSHLSSQSDAKGGVVVAQEAVGNSPLSSLPSSGSLDSLSLQKRAKPSRDKNKHKTTERMSGSNHRFVFSGLDPQPGTENVVGEKHWQKVETDDSITAGGIVPSTSTLVFVKQPSRPPDDSINSDKHDSIASEPPRNETPDGKTNLKANPLNFLPWFLSIGGANRKATEEVGDDDEINGESGVRLPNDTKDGSNSRPKRKKKKAKSKSKVNQSPVKNLGEDRTPDPVTLLPSRRGGVQAYNEVVDTISALRVSKEASMHMTDTDGCECFPDSQSHGNGTDFKGHCTLLGVLVNAADSITPSSRRNSLLQHIPQQCPPPDNAETILYPSDNNLSEHHSALGLYINSEQDDAENDCASVPRLDLEVLQNSERQRTGSTETSYYSAAPATPLFDERQVSPVRLDVDTTLLAALPLPDNETSNHKADAESDSAVGLSGLGAMSASRSRCKTPPQSSADQDCDVAVAILLSCGEEATICEESQRNSLVPTEKTSGETSFIMTAGHGVEEEARATSAGTESHQCILRCEPPIKEGSFLRPASLTRKDGRRLREKDEEAFLSSDTLPERRNRLIRCDGQPGFGQEQDTLQPTRKHGHRNFCLHQLPSFERIHPHRSLEREVALRMLSWLGLEEYVARRLKTVNDDGKACDSVVWITHSCSSRRTMAHCARAAKPEPYLCNSALWLRASMSAHEGSRNSRRESCDSVREYQRHLREGTNGKTIGTLDTSTLFPSAHTESCFAMSPTQLASSVTLVAAENSDAYCCQSGSPNVLRASVPRQDILLGQDSRELQHSIEQSMYELRHADRKHTADAEWMRSLRSVDLKEITSILAFFQECKDEGWQAEEPQVDYQRTPGYSAVWPEAAWPTTPYTPLAHGMLGSAEVENEVDESKLPGLSSGEMAEIEDAMYRDFLVQTSQHPRCGKKKDRHNQAFVSHKHRESRSKTHPAPKVLQGSGAKRLPGLSVDGSSSGAVTMDGNHALTTRKLSPTAKTDFAQTMRREGSSERQNDKVRYGGAYESPTMLYRSPQQLLQNEEARCVGTPLLNHGERDGNESILQDWMGEAKETEQSAVQSSLASLQRHLAMVTSAQRSRPRDERRRTTMSHTSDLGPTTDQAYHADWNRIHRHDTATSDSQRTIQSRGFLQAELQRQHLRLSMEARQLEERHLHSYALALDRSLHGRCSDSASSGYLDRGVVEAASCPDSLAAHWAYSGRDTPMITLTAPPSKEERLLGSGRFSAVPQRSMTEITWSDGDFPQMDEEARMYYRSGMLPSYPAGLCGRTDYSQEEPVSPLRRHSVQSPASLEPDRLEHSPSTSTGSLVLSSGNSRNGTLSKLDLSCRDVPPGTVAQKVYRRGGGGGEGTIAARRRGKIRELA